jgi:hypothetical protein
MPTALPLFGNEIGADANRFVADARFLFFCRRVFRVVGFFRGELALLAAGFAAFPFSAAPLDGAFSLSLAFAFFAMVKQLSLYPAELNSQAVFAKNWRELDPSLAFAMRSFVFRWLTTTGGSNGCGIGASRNSLRLRSVH